MKPHHHQLAHELIGSPAATAAGDAIPLHPGQMNLGDAMTTPPSTIARDIARNPYAWPGGYERYAITDDSAALCHRCCETEAATIRDSNPGDGWHVVAADHTGNSDERIDCDHCGAPIADDVDTAESQR